MTPDGVDINSVLSNLIFTAFDLKYINELQGMPDWVNNEIYSIQAKVDEVDIPELPKLSREQRVLMLQPVLKDRFHLRTHWEDRTTHMFSLRILKSGAKLKPSKPDANGRQDPVWDLSGKYHVMARNITISQLCFILLQGESGRPVLDQTGLTGKFDFDLSWSRPSNDTTTDASQGDSPGIFEALKQQLGLELVPGDFQQPVLRVDSIDRPTPN